MATKIAATRAKPAYAGRTVPDKSAMLSRAIAESLNFFLVRDGRTVPDKSAKLSSHTKSGYDSVPILRVREGRSAKLSRAADFVLVVAVSTTGYFSDIL